MAQKAVESAVRELHNLVDNLTKKICDLECKVIDQNSIIATQTAAISNLKLTIEGSSQYLKTNVTPAPAAAAPPTHSALQRPVRQVRLNAIAEKAAQAAVKQRASIGASTTPDVSRPVQKIKASVATKPAIYTTIDPTVEILDSTKHDQVSDNDWKKVVHKRSQKRKIVSGSGKTDDELQTVEQLRYIQAWSFKPETTVQNVVNYINKLEHCTEYFVEKRTIKTDRFSSFVIGFPERLYEKLSSPSSWPPLVKVSDWFLVRPRGPRGDIGIASSAGIGLPAASRG